MTLTDELCVRLNELGIEYTTYDTIANEAVIWTGSVCNWIALPSEYGLAVAVYKDYLTPEQAIAATVGAGTCKRVYHPNRITKTCTCSNCGYGASDERWAYCPKCGHKYVHGEVEERWKRAGRKVAE